MPPRGSALRVTITPVSQASSPQLPEQERVAIRRWLDRWGQAGARMDADRWRRLAALTDDQAWDEMMGLLSMWEPSWTGDDGDELLRHQDVFAKARRHHPR